MNSARQALTRMTNQLRTASSVQPVVSPSNQCSFFTGDTPAQDLTYEFRSADNKLYLITNSDGSEYVLCDNVTAAGCPLPCGTAISSGPFQPPPWSERT